MKMISSADSDQVKKRESVAKPSESSGSERYCLGGTMDEKKRKRKESNKESARRSRQRKQQHFEELIKEVGRLKRDNEEFAKKIGQYTAMFAAMDSQNAVLKGEKDRLLARLDAFENIIHISRVVRGSSSSSSSSLGYEEGFYDDLMMKPWQLPCYSLPITASSGLGCLDFDA